MNKITSNFDFLAADFPELHKAGFMTELLLSTDADACCAKLRYFGELWLKVWAREKAVRLSGSCFFDQIDFAFSRKQIDEDTADNLHKLREVGNSGAHVNTNSITSAFESTNVSKSQLTDCIKTALLLAEKLMANKTGSQQCETWTPPITYAHLLTSYAACHGDGQSALDIAIMHLKQLQALPHSNARKHVQSITYKVDDCRYWLNRAIQSGNYKAYMPLLKLLSGDYHPKAKDVDAYKQLRSEALRTDDSGQVHYFVAQQLTRQHQFESALRHLNEACEKGYDKAYADALILSYKYAKAHFVLLIEQGLQEMKSEALMYKTLTCATDDAHHQQIKPLYIRLKAMSVPGIDYVESILSLSKAKFVSQPDSNTLNTLLINVRKLPVYQAGAIRALTVVHHLDEYEKLTPNIVKQALYESQWQGDEIKGLVYYIVAMYDVHCSEHGLTRDDAFYFEDMLAKSRQLGCKEALDLEQAIIANRRRRIGRTNKCNRKQLKAKRKQSRMNRRKR